MTEVLGVKAMGGDGDGDGGLCCLDLTLVTFEAAGDVLIHCTYENMIDRWLATYGIQGNRLQILSSFN